MEERHWMTIPVDEFEKLHAEIQTLRQRIHELEVELRGYEWGMSNAAAEEHALTAEPDA